MINFNGDILDQVPIAIENNRAFLYGDAVFETLRVLDGKVLFLEDHYFRLMASMRIVRMQIPMVFTMEYFEQQILSIAQASSSPTTAFRVRFTAFRNPGGKYLPQTQETSFIAQAFGLETEVYAFTDAAYEVELFKDFYVTKHLLSTLKTTNKMIHIVGSIFADENDYQNCLLINDEKNVVEALNANVFLVKGNHIKTPPISDGCIKGILRKQLIEILEKSTDYQFEEASISPFELQKADEIFLTNCIQGIQPVRQYRKKSFTDGVASDLIKKLNAKIRFS